MEHSPSSALIGRSIPRVDGVDKVTGQARYVADIPLQGCLWGKTLRSPHPHARIIHIDVSRAKALPGVYSVLTGSDLSGVKFGRRIVDIPVLADGVVRFIGEQVAAVAAVDEETAERALGLIDVRYESLPYVVDALDAMEDSAPLLHPNLLGYEGVIASRPYPSNVVDIHTWGQGDLEQGFGESEVVVENVFDVPMVHQAYLESHACQAYVDSEGRYQVWANNKTPYNAKWQVAAALGVAPEAIRIHPVAIGGDFGGKGSPMSMALCCYLARDAKRPVRIVLDYSEEFLAANPRHSARISMRTGVKFDGTIVAHEADVVFNSGAYAGFKPRSFLVGTASAGGPYRIPHTAITAYQVYTNRVPCGHMRGPGEAQTLFALECQMDLIANELGISASEFRRLNLVRPGQITAIGHRFDEIRAVETLDLALATFERLGAANGVPVGWEYGYGVAFADRPPGGGQSSTTVAFLEDGTLAISTPVFEQGSGTYTLLKQVVLDTLDLQSTETKIHVVDTDGADWDSGVGANRVARIVSVSGYQAAREARSNLFAMAEAHLGWEQPLIALGDGVVVRVDTDEICSWGRLIELGGAIQGAAGVDESQAPDVTSFTAQVAEVAVDTETGQLKLLRLITAHDVGQIINPLGHQGQINGGVVMGIGYGLIEELPTEQGKVTTLSFAESKIPCMADIPELHTVLLQSDAGVGPFKIKSIGEAANGPPPAAIFNAVANATGVSLRSLPYKPDDLRACLHPRIG